MRKISRKRRRSGKQRDRFIILDWRLSWPRRQCRGLSKKLRFLQAGQLGKHPDIEEGPKHWNKEQQFKSR